MFRFLQNPGVTTVVATAVGLLAAAHAQAQTVRVDYSVPEETESVELDNGLDADVTLNPNSDFPNSDFWDLMPGVPETVFLSGGTVDIFQGANAGGSGTLTRPLTVSIGSTTATPQNLSQGVVVSQTAGAPPFEPASASIVLFNGNPVTYDLGVYQLTVTPLSSGVTGQTNSTFAFSNSAEFLLIPEPGSGLLVLTGALLLASKRSRRAKRQGFPLLPGPQ